MIFGLFLLLSLSLCNSLVLAGNYTTDFRGQGFRCGNGTQMTPMFNSLSFLYDGRTDTLYGGYTCPLFGENYCSCLYLLFYGHSMGPLVLGAPYGSTFGIHRVNSTQINSYEHLEIEYGEKIMNATKEYSNSATEFVFSISNFSSLTPPIDNNNNYVLSIGLYTTKCINSSLSQNIWPLPRKGMLKEERIENYETNTI